MKSIHKNFKYLEKIHPSLFIKPINLVQMDEVSLYITAIVMEKIRGSIYFIEDQIIHDLKYNLARFMEMELADLTVANEINK